MLYNIVVSSKLTPPKTNEKEKVIMAIVKSVKVAKSLIIPTVSWGGGRHLVAKSVLEDSKAEATVQRPNLRYF